MSNTTKSKIDKLRSAKLVRDERGAVFAEAVLTLPVFLLLYSLIVFVHTGFDKAYVHGKIARQDAWANTFRNCADDRVSSGTTRASASEGGNSVISGIGTAAEWIATGGLLAQYTLLSGTQPMAATLIATDRPLVTYGHDEYNYERRTSETRPIGGSSTVGNQVALRCNEHDRELPLGGDVPVLREVESLLDFIGIKPLTAWIGSAWAANSGSIKP